MSTRSFADGDEYNDFREFETLVRDFQKWNDAYQIVDFVEDFAAIEGIDESLIWTEHTENIVQGVLTDARGWHIASLPYPQSGFPDSQLDTEAQVECECCDGECSQDCDCEECEGEGTIVYVMD